MLLRGDTGKPGIAVVRDERDGDEDHGVIRDTDEPGGDIDFLL
jgi:hypothetical protein